MLENALVAIIVMSAIGGVLLWARGAFRKGSCANCGDACESCGIPCEAREEREEPPNTKPET